MINKFARNASKYSYYGYINLYTPQQLRRYQSQRHYYLGRKGAYQTLILKYASDHLNYQQQYNLRYKVPAIVTNISMRLGLFWFVSAIIISLFGLGDLGKVLRKTQFDYPGKPNSNGQTVARYQTLYVIHHLRQVI